MSNFSEEQQERDAVMSKNEAYQDVHAQCQRGEGSLVEVSLILLDVQKNDEAFQRLLKTFCESDVWILNNSDKRMAAPATSKTSDGQEFLVAFTSVKRAAATAAKYGMPHRPLLVCGLELVTTLGPSVGIVLNPNDPYFEWNFRAEHIPAIQDLYEQNFNFEVGGLYSAIGPTGSYHIVKLLRVDAQGVHIRIYANSFTKRPTELDPGTLTMAPATFTGPGGEERFNAFGHLPMFRRNFLAMGPRQLTTVPVMDGDLEGYRVWEENRGGYFGH